MGKKATFVIDEHVISEAKEIVEKGVFRSMNAFVESALRDEIEKIKREQIRNAINDASRDPLFLKDLREIEEDFRYSDIEEGR